MLPRVSRILQLMSRKSPPQRACGSTSCSPQRTRSSKASFELTRLEEVINQYAKQGWTVKAMTLPHIKGYGGVIEETVVVLLER